MPAELILNVALSGVLTGLVYGLMALGLSVIFGVVRVVNFAHGELMTLAMYGAVALFQRFGIDPLLTLPALALLFFGLGYALQVVLVQRFVTRPEHSQFLLLLAVAVILANAQLLAFGPDARNAGVGYALDSLELGPLLLDLPRLYAGAVALCASLAMFAFFRFSRAGKAIRACADNYRGAQVVGLPIRRLYALTFGLGCACVAVAGGVLTLLVDVTPALGPAYTLLGFVIVIVGGLGSLLGALLGGVLVGVSEALAGLFFTPSAKSMVSFGLLILVLLLRPQGLLGQGLKGPSGSGQGWSGRRA
jgi:branched-chain amino acid transport system permease protein